MHSNQSKYFPIFILGPSFLATSCKWLSCFPIRKGAQIWCNTQELQMPAHVTINIFPKVRKGVSFTKLLSTLIFFPKSGLFRTDTYFSSWFSAFEACIMQNLHNFVLKKIPTNNQSLFHFRIDSSL